MTIRTPSGLATRGRKLWRELTAEHTIPAAELVLLEEACRIADRLDRLDAILTDPDASWLRLRVSEDTAEVTVTVDAVLSEARQQANVLKQLITALRIPDEVTGKQPQRRGARGAYSTGAKTGATRPATVSALDRARAARGA